jgi:hypothetical protein
MKTEENETCLYVNMTLSQLSNTALVIPCLDHGVHNLKMETLKAFWMAQGRLNGLKEALTMVQNGNVNDLINATDFEVFLAIPS